jgi:hypothetical protein
MGKKKSREGQISKGERRNVVAGLGDSRTELQKLTCKVEAWKNGKLVTLTIANPIKSETSKPYIKVKASDVWGKYTPYLMKHNDAVGV